MLQSRIRGVMNGEASSSTRAHSQGQKCGCECALSLSNPACGTACIFEECGADSGQRWVPTRGRRPAFFNVADFVESVCLVKVGGIASVGGPGTRVCGELAVSDSVELIAVEPGPQLYPCG